MKTCWDINLPKVAVVYVYPTIGGIYDSNASRFAHSLRVWPASYPHELKVILNGANPRKDMADVFTGLDAYFMVHDNSGFDIGALQMAASTIPCDLMVFFGSSSYLRGLGWLERMVQSFLKHGSGLYGTMWGNPEPSKNVEPHIRTTCLWTEPYFINEYPFKVSNTNQRYPFEHGKTSLTNWFIHIGLPVKVVTWEGEYDIPKCGYILNAFHNGNQSQLIAGDRFSCPPFYHCA